MWVHDYHLMLLPKLLSDREKEVSPTHQRRTSIIFFLHIPFPTSQIFRYLCRIGHQYGCSESVYLITSCCRRVGLRASKYARYLPVIPMMAALARVLPVCMLPFESRVGTVNSRSQTTPPVWNPCKVSQPLSLIGGRLSLSCKPQLGNGRILLYGARSPWLVFVLLRCPIP